MTAPSKCSRPDAPPGSVLPPDALYEILLRLPAKDLCRLRAVCRRWRSLLSDRHFIAAHSAHHPAPLIVAGSDPHRDRDSGFLFAVLDLSGQVVKRVQKVQDWGASQRIVPAQLDVVCVQKGASRSCSLLDPDTGAVSALPEAYAEQQAVAEGESCNLSLLIRLGHAASSGRHGLSHMVVLAQVASTAQYKVLRVTENRSSFYNDEQLCEVLTFDGSCHARWIRKDACPDRITLCCRKRTVVNGVVYFLLAMNDHVLNENDDGPVRCISSFDLGTEEWRPAIRGPLVRRDLLRGTTSVTSLNGSLVMVHCIGGSSMDLWFLMDFESGLWVKQHSLHLELRFQRGEIRRVHPHPFMVLNDGRIFTYIESRGLLRIYDPRTGTYKDVTEIGFHGEVGLYTGNLLSLVSNAIS